MSWEKCLFGSSAHFWGGLFFVVVTERMSSLYILDVRPLSEASLANIFSYSDCCLFTLLTVDIYILRVSISLG